MKYINTSIPGLWIIEPVLFNDQRGYFAEIYKREEFNRHVGAVDFIQDNESKSSFGVLRGLHYQEGEAAQAKLVRVTQGAVLDIVVDLRAVSPHFGQSFMIELSEDNKRQLFIPRGFAHGFLVLSQSSLINYKVDNAYAPDAERTLNFFDPGLNIQLPIEQSELILSDKDRNGLLLKDIIS